MSTVLGTWLDGRPVDEDPSVWGVHVAEFLGCGFRVLVPARGGSDALAFVRDQVEELARVLDARCDDAVWEAAALRVADGAPLLLEGGWESVFRAPLGPPRTRLCVGEQPGPERHLPARELPWRVATGSALSALPSISTHEHRAALTHLGALSSDGSAGLWRTPAGALTGSTAGSVLALSPEGHWLHPAQEPGVVPTWTSVRLADLLGSIPTRLTDLDALRLVAVDAWGSLTLLEEPGRTDGGWAEPVRAALTSVLFPA